MRERRRTSYRWWMVLLLLLAVPTAASAGGNGNVNFFLGMKQLEKNDWEPVEDQGEFGAQMSWAGEGWPVHIATDVLVSTDEQTFNDPFFGPLTLTGSTWELDLGVRKIWGEKTVRPFIGGGAAFVGAEIEAEIFGLSVAEDDQSVGLWASGGVFFRLGSRFNIGVEVRWSDADVTIEGVDVAAGGVHYGMLLGWGWPSKN